MSWGAAEYQYATPLFTHHRKDFLMSDYFMRMRLNHFDEILNYLLRLLIEKRMTTETITHAI